jgi:hypothetical protein
VTLLFSKYPKPLRYFFACVEKKYFGIDVRNAGKGQYKPVGPSQVFGNEPLIIQQCRKEASFVSSLVCTSTSCSTVVNETMPLPSVSDKQTKARYLARKGSTKKQATNNMTALTGAVEIYQVRACSPCTVLVAD